MIVLVGFMGSGKSTVGRRLADELGLPFTDADDVIAAENGDIATFFTECGEAAFREMEAATIARLLTGTGVLALGGGACERAETRRLLAAHPVLFLRTSLEAALRRTGRDPRRPVLSDPALPNRFAARQANYAAVATHIIDTDGQRLAAVVAAAVLRLAQNERRNDERFGD